MLDETAADDTEATEEEADGEAEREKRQARDGSGARWCEALNTDESDPELPGLLINDDLVQKLNKIVDSIWNSEHQKNRRERMRLDLQLAQGEQIADLDSSTTVLDADAEVDLDGQIFQASYSVLQTIKNRITSFRPRAQFLPTAGDGKAKRASRNMTALSDAWADEQNYQDEATFAYEDKLQCDVGVQKIFEHRGKILHRRRAPWNVLVEKSDGKNRDPECIYDIENLPLNQVAAALGVNPATLVDSSSFAASPGSFGMDGGLKSPTVRIVDAYQGAVLPTEEEPGRKGRHVIVVGRRLMLDEDWEYEDLPFVIGRFDKRRVGWEGQSAMAKLRSAQTELNDHQVTLRETHYNSAGKVISFTEGETPPSNFNNDYVALIPLPPGAPAPTIQVPPAISNEAYVYLKTLKEQMFETLGVSQNVAQGQSRPGVTAAVAIREDTELQTDRLSEESQEWERSRVDVAKWWWRLTRDYARKHPTCKPKWKAISRGAWKEMVFEDLEGEYEIRTFPSSLFGQSLPGRFQRATDLIKEGWLEREDALAALDVPDISPTVDVMLAEKYMIEKLVDDIIEDEHYETPDEYINKPKLFEYARRRYFLALVDGGASLEALNLMRRLLSATKPPAQAAPQPPAVPGGPVAGGPPVPSAPPPPPLPGIAPPTTAGATPIGEPPMAPPGGPPGMPPMPMNVPPPAPLPPAVMQ